MNDLRAFVETRFAEDEWWARNSGGCFGNTPPETGEHWHWVESRGDTPITPDPTIGEHLDDAGTGEWRRLALRSIEEYPLSGGGTLPSFIVSTAEEVNTVAGGHIVRHDPARVLRDIAAKRQMFEECVRAVDGGPDGSAAAGLAVTVMKGLAAPYSTHPDYDRKWATS